MVSNKSKNIILTENGSGSIFKIGKFENTDKFFRRQNMSILLGLALFLLGGFIGVTTICILLVGAGSERILKCTTKEKNNLQKNEKEIRCND